MYVKFAQVRSGQGNSLLDIFMTNPYSPFQCIRQDTRRQSVIKDDHTDTTSVPLIS